MLTIALIESENGFEVKGTHYRLIAQGKARDMARFLVTEKCAVIERSPEAAIQERRAAQGLEAAV